MQRIANKIYISVYLVYFEGHSPTRNSSQTSEVSRKTTFQNSHYYFIKQIVWIVACLHP